MELLQLYNHLPITVEKDKDGIYIVVYAALGQERSGRDWEPGEGSGDVCGCAGLVLIFCCSVSGGTLLY